MIEGRFHAAMLDIGEQCKVYKYVPHYFLRMVHQNGGLATAKTLLHDAGISYGFEKLWELGRLDLTVEALVLQPQWNSLFGNDDRAAAAKKLEQLGYKTTS